VSAHSEGPAGSEIDDDRDGLDLDVEHGFATRSYAADGVPRDVVERSLSNSLNLGLYYEASSAPRLSMEMM
jgi:hypothetical protein